MNPYKTIWFKTSKTYDFVLKENHEIFGLDYIAFIVVLIVSIPHSLNYFYNSNNEELFFSILLFVIGTFGGAIILALFIVFIYWGFGKILQGRATRRQIRKVYFLSLLPFVFVSIFVLIRAVVLITYDKPYFEMSYGIYVAQTIAVILHLRFFVIGLSKVQQYSYGYAILNIFIPFGIIALLNYILTT